MYLGKMKNAVLGYKAIDGAEIHHTKTKKLGKHSRGTTWLECPGRDSNSYTLSGATPSRWYVYQFHHPGLKTERKCNFIP